MKQTLIAAVTAWTAYGALEGLFANVLRSMFFRSTYIPPSPVFLVSLTILYPLIGVVTGVLLALAFRDHAQRLANILVAILFTTNAIVVLHGFAVLVPISVTLLVAVGAFLNIRALNNGWATGALLIGPLWIAEEIGFQRSFLWKAVASLIVMAIVLAASFLMARLWRRPTNFYVAFGALVAVTLAALTLHAQPPRDEPARGFTPQKSSNILMVVLDTVRADHLSLYGYARRTSPNLDELAHSATVYANAFSPSNMTLTTHASWFTGLYGSEHGAHYDDNWTVGRPLARSAITVAERLAARGYSTAAVSSNYVYLGTEFGLDQGFQYLDARPPHLPYGAVWSYYLRSRIAQILDRFVPLPDSAHLLSRSADEINASVCSELDRLIAKRRPWFLFVNYMDAHSNCIPPPRFASMFPGRDPRQPLDLSDRLVVQMSKGPVTISETQRQHLISQYDGAIAYADDAVGRLIGRLRMRGVLDRTLVIITSDHGESFGERGFLGHGSTNYDDQIRVPLLVMTPGQRQPAVVSQPVSTMVIYDLLLSANIPASGKYEVVSEAFPLHGPMTRSPLCRSGVALVRDSYKFIENLRGAAELYDLARDPDERRNLAGEPDQQARVAALRETLRRWSASRSQIHVGIRPPVDPETRQRLRSLGYIQ